MFKLLINSEQAELNSNTRLQLNRVIFDINDISKRGINFTNIIKLPTSNINLRLTGYPNRFNTNNLSFENTYNYTLTDRDSIVSNGQLIVKAYSEKAGISIQMAEGYGFWNVIGRSKLNDLMLNQFDSTFNAATFTALSVKTGSPLLWALASNASDTTKTALSNLVYSRPSYRNLIILNHIIGAAGYSVDYGNLIANTNIDNIGCISNSNDFSVTDNKRHWSNIVVSSGLIDLTSATDEFIKAGNTTISGTNDLVNALYKTSYIIKGSIRSELEGEIAINTGSNIEKIGYDKGLTIINYRTDEVEIGSTTNFTLSTGVTLEDVRIYSHINESDIVEITTSWESSPNVSILDGYQILTDYNLPSITQESFFKVLIKQLFLKVDIDELKKEVKLDRFSDVIDSNNAIDLSGKSEKQPDYNSGSIFGQLNVMSYENDTDISDTLGQSTFNVFNNVAKKRKEFLKIGEFSSSNQVLISGNTTIDVPIYDVVENKRVSVKDRIVNFKIGVGIPYTCEFTGVSMQQLFSKNYISFINQIKRERIFKVKLYLSLLQFRNINKSPVIYLKELGSNFLVFSLTGFEEGNFTTALIVKYG